MATKKARQLFPPPLFLLLMDPGSEILIEKKSRSRIKIPDPPTLLGRIRIFPVLIFYINTF
jgi:hypothetical protein